MSAWATTAILLAMVPCGLPCLLFRHVEGRDSNTSVWLIRSAEASRWLSPFAIAIALVVFVMQVVGWLADRRASTPLPSPPADPLATYREGPPVECARHPFAG
jgi:hypothetical protein